MLAMIDNVALQWDYGVLFTISQARKLGHARPVTTATLATRRVSAEGNEC